MILDAGEVVRAGGREDLRDASVQRLLAVYTRGAHPTPGRERRQGIRVTSVTTPW